MDGAKTKPSLARPSALAMGEPLNLLFVSNYFPPYDLGGLENRCKETADLLRERGHSVSVLTSLPADGGQEEVEHGVYRTLKLETDIHYYRLRDFFLLRSHREKSNAKAFEKAIAETRPDLVVIWGMWNLSRNVPRQAEELLPARVVYFIADYWPIEDDQHTQYWRARANRPISELIKAPLRWLALKKLGSEPYPPRLEMRRVAYCSQFVRETLMNAGRSPEHSAVIYAGIDPRPYLGIRLRKLNGRRKLRLLYFGNVVRNKGVHTAFEALGILNQKGLAGRVNLTVLGGGHPKYFSELKLMAGQLGVSDIIRFVDRVPRSQIPSWLERFDVHLFTSMWPEPMARSVMEAMAAGLVVIGSNVGGQSEMLVDGLNSLNFEAGDSHGLARKILCVLEQPEAGETIAENGRMLVRQKFTLRRMVNEIEALLDSAANA